MANKKNKETLKSDKQEKQDVYVAEETTVIESDTNTNAIQDVFNDEQITEQPVCTVENEITTEKEDAVDAAVKEYNGEVKQERQIRIRDKSEIVRISKINKKVIAITFSVLAALLISLVAIAVINKMNTDVYRNIYLKGQNLSGMSTEEVTNYLKTQQENISKTTLKIFQGNEKILEIMPTDIDFEIDIAAVESKVFDYGRSSNVLKNNFDIVYALIFRKEFDLVYKYDVSKLSDIVKEVKESLDNKVIDDSYVVDEKEYKLIITRGKTGNTIEEENVKNKIISGLANGMGEYKLDVIKGAPTELDIDVVYSKVKRTAENAYIDKSTSVYKFVPHKVGLDFDKEELKKVLSEKENKQEGKVIEYALKVIEPEIKTSDIKWDMYEYKISSYTTYFSTTDSNRVNNLKVALNLLNGKVIMPGETFSYNAIVGGATAAQGFKAAATFVGGRVVSEVGGGICQTVSTLYNTALLANLEIVQRKAHSLPVAYVPGSRDATVYYPSIDFKFKNTREYPIKIITSFNSGGNLTIALYGTKEQNEYVVSISSKTLSTIPYKTEYVNDDSMEKGQQVVVQNGSNGYTSESYITKKLNGKIVSTTLLSKDTYKAVNRIVRIGTKEVSVVPSVPNENTGNSTSPEISEDVQQSTQPETDTEN